MTEDEMVGWHHRLNTHEFEQALRVGDGQGSPVCHNTWGRKELDIADQLNCTDMKKKNGLVNGKFFVYLWPSFLQPVTLSLKVLFL